MRGTKGQENYLQSRIGERKRVSQGQRVGRESFLEWAKG